VVPRNRISPFLVLFPILLASASAAVAMGSPWWENYERKDRYACGDRGSMVVERNDAQASVLTGQHRATLFRESTGGGADLRYRNGGMRLILRGDELTFEQLPLRLTCVRTEEA
jgi:hypothetical protein